MGREKLKAHEILRGLIEVGQFLSVPSVPLADRLEALLLATSELLACDRCTYLSWNGEGYASPVSAGKPPEFTDQFTNFVVAPDLPLLAEARAAGGSLAINDARNHPQMGRLAEWGKIQSVVIAMMDDLDGSPIGMLAAEFNDRVEHFTELDAEVVGGVAILAREAILTDRVRVARQRADGARRQMLDRLAEAEQRERRRIGHDIHDDVLQRVSSLSHFLEIAAGAAVDPEQRQHLLWLHEEARGSAIALRGLVQDLDPVDPESTTLRSILEGIVIGVNARASVSASLTVKRDMTTSVAVTRAIHRIARQAVDNAVEHSNASSIDVVLEISPDFTSVQVFDDGNGFVPDAVTEGIGLFSMAERARQLGGMCRVSSTPGAGTLVEARVPHAVGVSDSQY